MGNIPRVPVDATPLWVLWYILLGQHLFSTDETVWGQLGSTFGVNVALDETYAIVRIPRWWSGCERDLNGVSELQKSHGSVKLLDPWLESVPHILSLYDIIRCIES